MKKKVVSCLLTLMSVITLTGIVPVQTFADEADTAAVTTQEVTAAGKQGATVKYDQASNFTVTIPKSIALSGNKTATYQVKVKGDVAGNEKVTVVPDAEVTLNDANGKDPVTGTITQTKTEFSSAEISGGVRTEQ